MKRIVLSIVVLLVLLCGVAVAEEVTIVASGDCGASVSNVTWTLDSEGTLTIKGEGEMQDYCNYNTNAPWYSIRVSIKTAVIEAGVTSIGGDAFSYCSSLSSITIPSGVTSIGSYAFEKCISLSSITIPEGVASIGNYAFYDCDNLSSIAIPEGVTSIGTSVFYNCSSLRSITIPEGVTSIGLLAFSGCSSLSSISLPAGVTSIGKSAFRWCGSLSSISLPAGLASIGDSAFSGCSSLSSIDIPDGVTSIGKSVFEKCSGLSGISLPAGLTSIGNYAFYQCSSLRSITIPEGVTSIGYYAFSSCSSLRSITFPDGVASIGNGAFSGCSSLSSITLPAGLTSVGSNTFYECSSLHSIAIPEGVTSIGEAAFRDCSSLRSITIPDGVTSIGKYAFQYCSGLSSITIPDGVTSIGYYAFKYCYSLQKVMFLGNDMPTMNGFVFTIPPVVYCYEFSDVDFWATEGGYTCVYIDDMDLSKPISIDLPEDMRIEKGEIITISAGLFPQTATAEIVWQSSDPSVVSVENGVLTAKAIGEATITASCEGLSDQMSVTVYAPVESFELSETELWVISKETAQLDICNIEPVGATASFTWESSDTSVLTVDSGKITVLKPGDATVTVTSDNRIVRTCLVHVCYPVTAIELEQSEYQLSVGDEAQITAHVTLRDQSHVNRFVNFASSSEAVATVDSTGCIHAVSPGTATVTVSATNGISAACSVTVASCIHTPVTDPVVPATHVTTGLTEGSHCSRCGEILVAQQVIPIVEVEKLVLPAELETIEAEAFAGGSMVCVVIPEGCRAIGAGAFRNCAQLRFVEVPASVTTIDGSAFEGCSDLIIVAASGSVAEDFAQTHNITCVTYPQNG